MNIETFEDLVRITANPHIKNIQDFYDLVATMQTMALTLINGLPYAERINDLPHKSGLYFWESGGEILYIGKSFDIKKRWATRKDFSIQRLTRVHYLICEPDDFDLDVAEGMFISLLSPMYNRAVSHRVNPYSWKKIWRLLRG